MGHPRNLLILAVMLAALLGAGVAGASQLTAVGVEDPRPSAPIGTPEPNPTPRRTSTPTPEPTASPIPTPTPTPGTAQPWLYTIAEGDSLSGIATRFETDVAALLELNPDYVGNENQIEVGDQLLVPCTPVARGDGRCG